MEKGQGENDCASREHARKLFRKSRGRKTKIENVIVLVTEHQDKIEAGDTSTFSPGRRSSKDLKR
jgi:hypothetical protein